jgi:hypothetical protein
VLLEVAPHRLRPVRPEHHVAVGHDHAVTGYTPGRPVRGRSVAEVDLALDEPDLGITGPDHLLAPVGGVVVENDDGTPQRTQAVQTTAQFLAVVVIHDDEANG